MSMHASDYTEETCVTAGCGIVFLVSKSYRDRRVEDKAFFHCPNGHSMHYLGKTAEQKLRELRDQKDAEISTLKRQVDALQRPKRGRPRKPKP